MLQNHHGAQTSLREAMANGSPDALLKGNLQTPTNQVAGQYTPALHPKQQFTAQQPYTFARQ